MIETPVAPAVHAEPSLRSDRTPLESLVAYCSRNPHLVAGGTIVLFLFLIGWVGPLFVNVRNADPLSTLPTMVAAHRLYERLGFRRAPALDHDPVAGVHLLAYALDL